jgi:hypothetical protein
MRGGIFLGKMPLSLKLPAKTRIETAVVANLRVCTVVQTGYRTDPEAALHPLMDFGLTPMAQDAVLGARYSECDLLNGSPDSSLNIHFRAAPLAPPDFFCAIEL